MIDCMVDSISIFDVFLDDVELGWIGVNDSCHCDVVVFWGGRGFTFGQCCLLFDLIYKLTWIELVERFVGQFVFICKHRLFMHH